MLLIRNSFLCVLLAGSILLSGCAGPRPVCITEGPVLPQRPYPVVVDNGHRDLAAYPNTRWVKAPKTDPAKAIAWWSYKDIQTISDSLTDWNIWADAVEELVAKHNASLKQLSAGETEREFKPWYSILGR